MSINVLNIFCNYVVFTCLEMNIKLNNVLFSTREQNISKTNVLFSGSWRNILKCSVLLSVLTLWKWKCFVLFSNFGWTLNPACITTRGPELWNYGQGGNTTELYMSTLKLAVAYRNRGNLTSWMGTDILNISINNHNLDYSSILAMELN